MIINSVNSYSPFTYASVSTSTSDKVDSENMSPKGADGQKGPGGPGGPKGGGPPPKGPDLDTDKDGSWSKSELEEYASFSSEELGVSLDVDEIISKYDEDGDGKINSNERDALGKDNGLQLPSPEKMMEHMMSMSQNNFSNNDNDYNIESINKNTISKYISSYTATNNYNDENLLNLLNVTA